MRKFSVILAIKKLVLAANIRPGSCPVVPRQPNFEIARYLGEWYNYLTNDEFLTENKECITATYGLLNDQQISVNNTSKSTIVKQ